MLTYEKSGVSIDKGNDLVRSIKTMTKDMRKVVGGNSVGGFAAIADFPKGYKKPQMVLATDGVGTKILLCKQTNNYKTVGIDLVAMSVNDILTLGAEPYLFLDYYATSKLDPKTAKDVLKGVVTGCKKANIALVGGETAEMPGVYTPGDFDLAGFCVGVVEKNKTITGAKIKPGDVVIGLGSSGIHSNGYSLVRSVLTHAQASLDSKLPGQATTWGKELMKPTKIYVEDVLPIIRSINVSGMAHVTGGGLAENVARILPEYVSVHIQNKSWRVPKVFSALQELGDVPHEEMMRTFNMGIGYVMIVPEKDKEKVLNSIPSSKVIGQVEKSKAKTPSVTIV